MGTEVTSLGVRDDGLLSASKGDTSRLNAFKNVVDKKEAE